MSVDQNDVMTLKKRLTIFYEKYCPDKVSDINNLIKKYGNKEKDLFRKLTMKYGPEPKMSEFQKETIRKRVNKDIKSNITTRKISKKELIEDEFLDEKTLNLLNEIDKLGNKPITKDILDKI